MDTAKFSAHDPELRRYTWIDDDDRIPNLSVAHQPASFAPHFRKVIPFIFASVPFMPHCRTISAAALAEDARLQPRAAPGVGCRAWMNVRPHRAGHSSPS